MHVHDTAKQPGPSVMELVTRSSDAAPEAVARDDVGVSAALWRRHAASLTRTERLREHLLSYCLRGGGRATLLVDGQPLRSLQPAGMLLLLPAGSAVQWQLDAPGEALHLHLYLAPQLLADMTLQPVVDRHDPWLDGFFRLLAADLELNAPRSEQAGSALLHALVPLVVERLRRWHPARRPGERGAVNALRPTLLRRVESHVDAHLAEALPIPALAALTGLSVDHFTRAFQQAVGEPPHRWLLERRLDRAHALLRETILPIAEIAHECGFASASHFAASFRRRYGRSPGHYRRGT